MLTPFDTYNGMPIRLYRSPVEIKQDISAIAKRIKATNERFNVRHMLLEVLTDSERTEPEETVELLEEVLSEARESLFELSHLKEALSDLEAELRDTRCALS